MVAELSRAFEERQAEVSTYIDFLKSLEQASQYGAPKLHNTEHTISIEQQRILYSGVFLQLYNLVESTITRCIEAVSKAATENGTWQVKDLSDLIRSEWVKVIAETHKEMGPQKRLDAAVNLCNHLISDEPIRAFLIDKSGGGNWDDKKLEKFVKRIGLNLNISDSVSVNAKRPFKDDYGSLGTVKKLRNDLAHGIISFIECGSDVTVSDLERLKDNTTAYLREVVGNFIAYIEGFEYLAADRRPGNSLGKQEYNTT